MTVAVTPLSKLFNRVFRNRPASLDRDLLYFVNMIGSDYEDKWMAKIKTDEQMWDAIRSYLERGADINARGDLGKSVLIRICENNHLRDINHAAVAAKMIAEGADPNMADSHLGFTALMMAAMEGRHNLMKALIDGGANVNATTLNKKTSPLSFLINNAEYKCRDNPQTGRDCLQLLLDNGVTLSDEDKQGIFKSAPSLSSLAPGVPEALEVAAAAGNADVSVLKELLDKGANPDAAAAFGQETPLQSSIRTKGSGAHIDVLLAAGASIKLPSPVSGLTPLQESIHAGNRKLFEKLLNMGADPESPRRSGAPADLLALARASNAEGMEEFVRKTLETYPAVQFATDIDHDIEVSRPLHLKLKKAPATPSYP